MNELMNLADEGNMLMDLTSKRTTWSSINPKTEKEKVAFYNAVNTPTKRLKEMLNLEVEISNVYAEVIDFIDRESGEATPGVRMVFIAPDGTSYQAASKGIYSCTQKLFNIFGTPDTWKHPVKIRPKEVSKAADRNVLVFEIVQ